MGWRGSGEHPAETTRTAQSGTGHRTRGIDARYTVTMTYAKRTLTLPAGLPRFVTPSKRGLPSAGIGCDLLRRCCVCPRSA